MNCCKSKEWDLRTFLKKKLKKAGFTITEDNYTSRRTRQNGKYSKVHNLLAVRGTPRVCLVAHTDVCRDHGFSGNEQAPDVFPILKNFGDDKSPRIVVQDRDCRYQTGGDDRLGVAINTWIALNTGYDIALLFTTDEEVGLVSASAVKFDELMGYDLLVQVDRGNHSKQLVTNIGGTILCTPKTTARLLKIAEDMDIPRSEVRGLATDVMVIIGNDLAREAVNMTCGYHNSFGESSNEYIDVQEAKDTMKYVSEIVQYYDLEKDAEEIEEDSEQDEDSEVIEGHFEDPLDINDEILEMMTIEEYIAISNRLPNKRKTGRSRRRYVEDVTEIFSEENLRRLTQ